MPNYVGHCRLQVLADCRYFSLNVVKCLPFFSPLLGWIEDFFFEISLPIFKICEITISKKKNCKNNPAFATRAPRWAFTLKVPSDLAHSQKFSEGAESLGAFSVDGDLIKFPKNWPSPQGTYALVMLH